jgi:membrane protease YdiL (CAAX protease family)
MSFAARQDVPRTAIDLAIVLATIAAMWVLSRWVLYPALSIPDNAPYILRPIGGFLAAWAVVRWRGEGLRSLGLRRPDSWKLAIAAGIALYAINWLLGTYVLPLFVTWFPPSSSPGFLAYIRGNATGFATWLAIGWLVGGFCEEVLFRGFLLRRVATLLGESGAAVAIAILAQALFFGSLHLYASPLAFVSATLFGIAQGVCYIAAGRNLLPLIVVHGVWNTVGIWAVYQS